MKVRVRVVHVQPRKMMIVDLKQRGRLGALGGWNGMPRDWRNLSAAAERRMSFFGVFCLQVKVVLCVSVCVI